MKPELLDLLVDPCDKQPLELHVYRQTESSEIIEGLLTSASGHQYPIRRGIPRFIACSDGDQGQTADSFAFKWQQRDSYDSPAMLANYRRWLASKYGFTNPEAMSDFFASRRRILEIGCGAGCSASTWLTQRWSRAGSAMWIGVDISQAVDVAQQRLGGHPRTHLIQADLMQLPLPEGSFDTVFSEGVLHHTPSTQRAIEAAARYLEPGGEILFYVYRKKGPIREFTDDYVRQQIACLPPAEAWELLKPFTKLGQALAELDAEFEVPEDIPMLGIQAGRVNLQRFVYWNIAKLFWNSDFTFEENHHVNFDWYHPRYAHRQTEAELRQWCADAGLQIEYLHTQPSGYTVRARKLASVIPHAAA